ncbi:MAG: hypothetical protein STSR0008_02590 [Ignavibacterium sp.]
MQKVFSQHKKLCSFILIIVYSAFLLIYVGHIHRFNFDVSNYYFEQVSSQNSNHQDHFIDNLGNCLIQQFSQSLINLDYIPHQFTFLTIEEIFDQSQTTNILLLSDVRIPRAPPLNLTFYKY